VGHITPEAQDGGLIALLQNGDPIVINAETNTIHAEIDPKEIEYRRKKWKQPPLKFSKGILYKYAKTVSTASEGCVTDTF
ncbi:MAG: dihydroxy-acid dehydratase, partial [Flavobacteriaceae bacterium]|nr:dihydroxy-acid dehydratase [Flavobacteriaceae bacterium]